MPGRSGSKLRCLLLLRILSSRRQGVTVDEMADETGVSYRTIQRDIEDFREAGLPIHHEIGEFGRKRYRVSTTVGASQLTFRFDEAVALYLGRQFMEPLAGTYFWEGSQSAFKKIRTICGDQAIDYLEKLANRVHVTSFGISDYSKKADLIDILNRSIEDSIQIIITYHPIKATEPVEYSIDPYGLVYHRGALYVIAYSHDSKGIRHFKVDRIEEIESSEFKFERPTDFNLATHLEPSFGIFQGTTMVMVSVRFHGSAARLVKESIWHQAQKIVENSDGSILADFELSATEEIKRWIFSFGKSAEVLSPKSLRDEIARDIQDMLQIYKSSKQHLTKVKR